MDFTSAVLTLIIVIDPLGNIPSFMAAMRSVPDARRLQVIARELVFALVILLGVFFGGRSVMKALSLSDDALRISGGIVLFLIALRMVFPPEHHEKLDHPAEEEPFIVPLATPLIAGPSVMATIMFIGEREPARRFEWLFALFVAWLASAIVLLAAPFFARILQRRGLMAVERLMGMVLVVVSVQMFLDGLHLANVPAK
jgi:multiple antibiotic resistance protein